MILGTGIDIVELNRLRVILKKHGERFLLRIYTIKEREDLGLPVNSDKCFDASYGSQIIQRAAGRFAAKEAFLKAIGTGLSGGITWRDIELLTDKMGAPKIKLRGKAAEMAKFKGCRRIHVSISHSKSNAVALVVIEGDA